MPDTASNIIVQTVGNTANIGTDYGTNGVNLATAHVLVVMLQLLLAVM